MLRDPLTVQGDREAVAPGAVPVPGNARFREQGRERILVGTVEPGGAEIDRRAGKVDGAGAPADPVARLEHQHIAAGRAQLARRAETSHPGADDDRMSSHCGNPPRDGPAVGTGGPALSRRRT